MKRLVLLSDKRRQAVHFNRITRRPAIQPTHPGKRCQIGQLVTGPLSSIEAVLDRATHIARTFGELTCIAITAIV